MKQFSTKKFNKQLPYRHLLVGTACVLLLATLCMSLFLYANFDSTLSETFYYFTSGNAYMAINDVENMIDDLRNIAFELSKEYEISQVWFEDNVSADDMYAMQDIMSAYSSYDDTTVSIYAYSNNNNTLYTTHTAVNLDDKDKINKNGLKYILPLLQDGNYGYRESVVKLDSGYSNVLCVQYFPHNNFTDCIIIRMNIDNFVKKIISLDLYQKSYYMILNDDNTVLYSNVDVKNVKNKLLVEVNKNADAKNITKVEIAGENHLCALFQSDVNEKKIVISVPENIVYANAALKSIKTFFVVLVWALVAIVLLILALWYFAILYDKKRTNDYLNIYSAINSDDEKQGFLRHVLENSDDDFIDNLPERSTAAFLHGNLIMVLMRFDGVEEHVSPEENKMRLYAVLKHVFSSVKTEDILLDDDLLICLLVKGDENVNTGTVKDLLVKANGLYENGSFISAVSDVTLWRGLKAKYKMLTHMLEYGFIYGENAIITEDMVCLADDNENSYELMLQMYELKREIIGNAFQKADELLNNLWEKLVANTPKKVRTYTFMLLNIYSDLFEWFESKTGTFLSFDYTKEFNDINNAQTADEILKKFKGYNMKMTFSHEENKNERQRLLCNQVKAIVADNYSDVSLGTELISQKIGTSSGYIGKLFRRVEGITILNYILKFRMNKAIELLKIRDDLTLNQIAKMLGYSTTSYFGTVFKKEFKMTPGEYRACHKKSTNRAFTDNEEE